MGVRHLLIEYEYCNGVLLNQYLAGGDEDILRRIWKACEMTAANSQENYDFFKRVYAYNLTLPEDAKLHISAIDLQHQFQTGLYYLTQLLPGSTPPETMAEDRESIHFYVENKPEGGFRAFIPALWERIQANEDAYLGYLGEENVFPEFMRALHSIYTAYEYYETGDEKIREQYITDTCVDSLEAYPNEKAYGAIGYFHANMIGMEDDMPVLANHLQHDYEKTAGKVTTIAGAYAGCELMYPMGEAVPLEDTILYASEIAAAMPSDNMLCSLVGDGSPYLGDDFRTLKRQQYFVLMRDSKACTLYAPEDGE